MKLITEEVSHVEFITEKVGKETKTFIQGVFLQGDICNRNGRMYPMETLSREVNRYNEAFICKGRALGELGHPDGPTVNLDRVSHKIVSLEQKGCNFIGKAQLLGTPMGKIAEALIKEGVCLGVSSRGVGSLQMTNEGHKIVGKDFISAFLVQNEEAEAETGEEKPVIKGNETTQQTLLVNEDLLQEERDKIKRLLSDDDSLLNQPKPKFKPKVPPKDDDQPKLF
jgi:hypothetical protein